MVKTIVTYLLMVGIPLAGLLWILDEGEKYVAPPAIKGHWAIEDSGETQLTSCFGEQPSELVFEQSGRFIHITLGGAKGNGRFDDEHLSANLGGGACGTIELEGSFDEATEQFTGRATASGCEACSEIGVVARRKK